MTRSPIRNASLLAKSQTHRLAELIYYRRWLRDKTRERAIRRDFRRAGNSVDAATA
jgi:hypothetical protein